MQSALDDTDKRPRAQTTLQFTMESGKSLAPSDTPSKNRVVKTNPDTLAATWNARKLREIQAKLKIDPEADLTLIVGPAYSQKLRDYHRPPREHLLLPVLALLPANLA